LGNLPEIVHDSVMALRRPEGGVTTRVVAAIDFRHRSRPGRNQRWRFAMSWNKPVVTEVCIGLEINDYFPAEI